VKLLLKRVITSVVGLIVFCAALIGGQVPTGLVIALLVLLGLHEYNKAFAKAGYKPLEWISYLSVVVVTLITYDPANTDRYLVMVLILTFFAAMTVAMLCDKFRTVDVAVTVMGILYVTGMFSFILRIRLEEAGGYLVWFIFAGAWGADTFAYFIGRWFGRKKIIPRISPGKTVEGSIAGVIGGVVFAVLYGIISGGSVGIWESAGAGLLAGIVSQLGDWMASAIKRFAGVKDFGKILPGHGGVLDRFDSILFTAPVLYYYFAALVGL
jgi:phosphatidate cytidylyltransferase